MTIQSLKNYVNAPSKRNKQRQTRKIVFLSVLKGNDEKYQDPDQLSQRHGSADPDQHQNIRDPQHLWLI
jgi:hypothetical protein